MLGAELVVDATGRGSRTPVWLDTLGYERPKREQVKIELAYVSRTYRMRPDALGGDLAVAQAATPNHPRTGALQVLEGDRGLVTLAGILGDHPPTESLGMGPFGGHRELPGDGQPDHAVSLRPGATVVPDPPIAPAVLCTYASR